MATAPNALAGEPSVRPGDGVKESQIDERTCEDCGRGSAHVARLEAEIVRLREFYEAWSALEGATVSFEVHNEAVERLERAEEAIRAARLRERH